MTDNTDAHLSGKIFIHLMSYIIYRSVIISIMTGNKFICKFMYNAYIGINNLKFDENCPRSFLSKQRKYYCILYISTFFF